MAFDLKTNPVLGATLPPSRPADYAFETKGPRIIWSMSIALSVMVIITGLRLGVRMFRRGLMVGLDDVFIIPSVVSFLSHQIRSRHTVVPRIRAWHT